MILKHVVGYSKSTRAKCHAPGPCKDTPLPVGTLRYGQTVSTELGETLEWRHWGCVSPQILNNLARTSEKGIDGFNTLKPADQNKMRLAISLLRIDSADIPPSARVCIPDMGTSSLSTQKSLKRTGAQAGLVETTHSRTPFNVAHTARIEHERVEDVVEDVVEDEVRDELYCEMATNVVGVQYYKGLVGPGEEVRLVREPQNTYDRNAIKVENIGLAQVGHLPRNVVAKLSPLLDQQAVTVEGVINNGNLAGSRSFTLSMTLKIYGPSDKRSQLEPALVWATPGQRGFNNRNSSRKASTRPSASVSVALPPTMLQAKSGQVAAQTEAIRKQQEALYKAAELRQMISALEKVDDEGRRASLLDTLFSTEDILSLPEHPNPPGIATGELTVDLMKHQRQALEWCIQRENPVLPKTESDKPVQFWQFRERGQQPYYYNIATKTPQENAPSLGKGALYADAMGLGKTLTMIALTIATKSEVDKGFSKSTLVVVPLSVLSNWEKQIADHCVPATVSTRVYYGSNRKMSASEMQNYDVIITTYQTVAGEYEESSGNQNKKRKSDRALFEVAWKRVILDEGHSIRNPKTKMAKSVVGLNASRRWVLSGTPIINSPKDLGSILTFLKICRPLDNEDFFKRLLLRPLKNGELSGVELLKALMSHICIRRTKETQDNQGNPLIHLPPVEMIRVPVTLSDDARHLYDEIEQLSKQRLENVISESGVTAAVQSNALSMLTRLRQIALHPGLVPVSFLDNLRSASSSEKSVSQSVVLTPAERTRLQEVLAQAIEDSEECPICMDILNNPRISGCGHMYCLTCITEVLTRDPKCPMDRRQLTPGDLFEPPPSSDLTQRPIRVEEEGLMASSSAKVDQLVHLLKLTPSTEKSLVFSQFTSFIDKIAERFEEEGISYVRFDGQMSAKRRQEAIARFSVPLAAESVQETEVPSRGRVARTRNNRFAVPVEFGANSDDGTESDFVTDGEDDEFTDDPTFLVEQKTTQSKGKGKAAAIPRGEPSFDTSDENPRVMLLSLKAGALGLNLTVANNVYLMDPWWQEGIESQAVDRVNRIGQKKPVHVYQLVADNTVESKVLDIQEKKKKLIQQAFSGIKRTETQRQQREARLQDLIELFGIRRQAIQSTY